MRCKETMHLVLQFLYNVSRIEHLYIAIHSQHNSREGPLKLTDKIRSLKRKENWRKLHLLGIQTGDNLARPLFFVAYSRLCRHCRNLGEGGCVFPRFHFTFCRYFLGHVACRNLPWQGLGRGTPYHFGSKWNSYLGVSLSEFLLELIHQ